MLNDLSTHLIALERSLLDPAVRSNPAEAGKLLTEDFREFGSSGKIWSRSEILEALAAEEPASLEATGFEVRLLGQAAALVTYRASRIIAGQPSRHTLRSSIWQLQNNQWRILFHQGTPIP